MATVYWMDALVSCNDTTDVRSQYWNIFNNCALNATGGRQSGGSVYAADDLGLTYINLPNLTTAVVNFAFWSNTSSHDKPIIALYDQETCQCCLSPTYNNRLQIFTGYETSLLGISSKPFRQSIWNFVEWKVTINGTTGASTLKINGETVSTLTSVDTQQSSNAQFNVMLINGSNTTTVYISDMFVTDDFVGDNHIYQVTPNANSSVTWTPLSGNNYENVDDAQHSTSTYNYTSTDANTDLLELSTINSNITNVEAVQVVVWGKLGGAGASTISPVLKSGSTQETGTGQYLQPVYLPLQSEIYELDPDTSSAWTLSGVQNALVGYKLNTES